MELSLIKQLGEFGLLGIFLALVWWIALRLWRELQRSWEERLSESRQLASVIETTNRSYAAMAAATDSRAHANEAMAQAQAATSEALVAQMKTLKEVSESQKKLSREVHRLFQKIEQMNLQGDSVQTWASVSNGRKARV